MGTYFARTILEQQVFASVAQVDDPIDVFVSHKSDDEDMAMKVARCLQVCDLTVWVDAIDMTGVADDQNMVHRIEAAISHATSLIAVVTDVTKESWWVPFEIGLAYEKEKQLASYCEDPTKIDIPSFLWSWPLIEDHVGLHKWCTYVKKTPSHTLLEARETEVASRQAYRNSLFAIRDQLRG